jgi:hypothetical protein
MNLSRGFASYGGAGFTMSFDNAWSVSVHFVRGNYCANDTMRKPDDINSSPNAEVLITGPDGRETVHGWQNPEQVAFLLKRTAMRKSPAQLEHAKREREPLKG